MPDVTVIIPTYRRPELLRSALASVAAQSASVDIERVIVSENSDDLRSHAVCADFSTLPIDFVARRPALEPTSHFCQLVAEVRTSLVAMIADDDMWSINHIATALRYLNAHPSAAGYFGQTVVVDNDSRQVLRPYGRAISTILPPGSFTFRELMVWEPVDALIECLLRTPLVMWSLVGRTAAVVRGMSFMEEGATGLDADRFFSWRLACEGPLLVGPEISLFMRTHEGNDCARMEREAPRFHRQKSYEYTTRMIEEAESLGLAWREAWLLRWSRLSPDERSLVWGNRIPGARDALRDALGPSFRPPDPLFEGSRIRLARDFVPPVCLSWIRDLRRTLWTRSSGT